MKRQSPQSSDCGTSLACDFSHVQEELPGDGHTAYPGIQGYSPRQTLLSPSLQVPCFCRESESSLSSRQLLTPLLSRKADEKSRIHHVTCITSWHLCALVAGFLVLCTAALLLVALESEVNAAAEPSQPSWRRIPRSWEGKEEEWASAEFKHKGPTSDTSRFRLEVVCAARSLRNLAAKWSGLHHKYRRGDKRGLYGHPIPRVIHQTYGKTPIGFESPSMESWSKRHPGFEHIVWSDSSAREFVAECVPSALHLYDAVPLGIMRSDMLRYLLLLVFGGIWSDADAQPLKPYKDWLRGVEGSPSPLTTTFIAAVESDADTWQRLGYVRSIQMAQWTMAAAPDHPVVRRVVDQMMANVKKLLSGGLGREGVLRVDILNTSGPGVWSDGIVWYLEQRGHSVEELKNMSRGRVVGGMVFLPITAFSPGVGVGAKSELDEEARVRHWFGGSWKNETMEKSE